MIRSDDRGSDPKELKLTIVICDEFLKCLNRTSFVRFGEPFVAEIESVQHIRSLNKAWDLAKKVHIDYSKRD